MTVSQISDTLRADIIYHLDAESEVMLGADKLGRLSSSCPALSLLRLQHHHSMRVSDRVLAYFKFPTRAAFASGCKAAEQVLLADDAAPGHDVYDADASAARAPE